MLDAFLVPAKTVVTAKGDSDSLDIGSVSVRSFLLTLSVAAVVEQEAIEVSVFTSADGTAWDAKPIAALPQKFYVGQYPLLVDLAEAPQVKFVRAHWEVNRWGRGSTQPSFEIAIRWREVPREMLDEARAEAHTRR